MKTQKERLIAFINATGYSIRAFEIKTGMSNATISHCSDNLSANVKEKVFARFPQLHQEWLLHGIGEMLNGTINDETDTRDIRDDNETIEALRMTIEKMQKTIDIQEREIAGLYERIEEIKRGVVPQRSVATA